jgi:hypothetical protein
MSYGCWFNYSTHKSADAAYDALEDMFASGELSEAEAHRVEKSHGKWHIVLWDGDEPPHRNH